MKLYNLIIVSVYFLMIEWRRKMPLVKEAEILEFARQNGFAVPGFFAFNYEFIKEIIDVAEEENSPVVLCQGPEFIESFGEHIFTEACKAAANNAKVPVALAVDHTFVTDESTIPALLRDISLGGWSSFMLDGSLLPYDKNVSYTKRLVDICKGAGVNACGALAEVRRFFPQAMNYSGPFKDDFVVPPEIMTDPIQAKDFVEKTGVHTLAISIGQYCRSLWDGEKPPFHKTARLDFERLASIRKNTDVHLVMHGNTHVHESDLEKASLSGVSLIKIASEQALLWANEIRDFTLSHSEIMFPEDIQRTALKQVKESMRHYIRLLHANDKVKKR